MAKTAAKKKNAPAEAVALPKKGTELVFKGYSEEVENPLFEKGDILVVDSAALDDNGTDVKVIAYRKEDGKKATREAIFMPDEAELFDGKAPKGKAAKKAVEEDDEELEDEDEVEDSEEEFEDDEEAELEDDEEAEEEAEEEAPAKSKSKAKASAKTAVAKGVKASSKAKQPPARTKEEDDAEFTHVPSVQKLIKKGDMLEAAQTLVRDSAENYYNLGGVLSEIHRAKAFTELGYEDSKAGFEDYINTELKIEYKKATMLMTVYKTFSRMGITADRFGAIGWTKAGVIASLMRDSSVEEIEAMLDAAAEMTRDDLIEHIKETSVDAAGRSRGDKVKRVKYTFTAFADEAEYIGSCLNKVMQENDIAEQNEAFIHIIREWASMVDGIDLELKDAIKVVEKRFGVKLDVADEGKEKEMPRTAKAESAAPKAKAEKAVKKTAAKKAPAKKAVAKKAPAKKTPAKKAAGKKKTA